MHTSTTRLAAAVIAVGLAVSCASTPAPVQPPADQAARNQKRDTQDIVADYIAAQLNADPWYFYRHVNVTVDDDGVATLSGYVWDTQAIYRARRIASAVPGVTRVVTSQLQLERNGRDTGPAR
jgi:osmotically-inducible protein OsmY